MPATEDLLRAEFERVTDAVRPGLPRPLRVPGPRRPRLIRLIPAVAGAAW